MPGGALDVKVTNVMQDPDLRVVEAFCCGTQACFFEVPLRR
jgi:hypothetical protein